MGKKVFVYHTTVRTMLADVCTPVGVYMKLRDLYPQSILMESSDYHDSSNSKSYKPDSKCGCRQWSSENEIS